jgi:hypothetical protein
MQISQPLKEAVKEVLRLGVLAVVSWAIASLAGLEGEFFLIVTALLRAVDKWIHENPSKFNGLLPF